MYKIVGSPRSRLTRVSWMLQELEQEYEIIKASPHSVDIKKFNPAGKGPVLVDGDASIIDSAAICAYLADKHFDKGMSAPFASPDRAKMDSWLHFAQNDLEAPMWLKMKHKFMLPEELRADVSAVTKMEFSNAINAMEKRLGENEFALGENFSAADILLGHCGQWARSAKFEIKSEVVNAYFDRVLGRPALARAKELEENM